MIKICENCNKEHDGTYGSGRFCNNKCARGFSTKNNRKEINKKVSNSLKGKSLSDEHKLKVSKSISKVQIGRVLSEEHKRNIAKTLKKSSKSKKEIKSILDVSKRTITKILTRMNVGCSRCGWNESTCDIHHINGRKIEDSNNHSNLCLLCPNCHRLVHTNKIDKSELISLLIYFKNEWLKHYYFN